LAKNPPLVVDLDGTVLRSDLLVEAGLLFMRNQPHRFLAPLHWLVRGKTFLKHQLAHETEIDVTVLPYDKTVIEFIGRERGRGRKIVLATSSHCRMADQVADYLGFFDEVIASNAGRNLSGQVKRDVLVQSFGDRGFDYAGNSSDDLPVWGAARNAYLVNASAATEDKTRAFGNVVGVLGKQCASVGDWINAFRMQHWCKNLLVFVPLLAAHRYSEWLTVVGALLAFLCFGLCASSVYILNDLFDLQEDRHHVWKRLRPFADGRLSIQYGLIASFLLLITC
jgi:hypothetical protein